MKNLLLILSLIICSNIVAQNRVELGYKKVCLWNSQKSIFDECSEEDLSTSYVIDTKSATIFFDEFSEEFTIPYYKIINRGNNVYEYVVSEVKGDEFSVIIPKDNSYFKIIYVNVGQKTSLTYSK